MTFKIYSIIKLFKANPKPELSFYKQRPSPLSSSSSRNKLTQTNKSKPNHLKKNCKCFNAKRSLKTTGSNQSKPSVHINQCKKEIDDLLKLYS